MTGALMYFASLFLALVGVVLGCGLLAFWAGELAQHLVGHPGAGILAALSTFVVAMVAAACTAIKASGGDFG